FSSAHRAICLTARKNEEGAVSRALFRPASAWRLGTRDSDSLQAGAELDRGRGVTGLESRARRAADVVVRRRAAVLGVLDAVAGVRVHRNALDVRADAGRRGAESRT